MLDGATAYPDATVTSGGAGISVGEIAFANSHGMRYASRQSGSLGLARSDQRPVHRDTNSIMPCSPALVNPAAGR